jgi:O-antigen/teichoic acid export membrane protein
MGHALITNTLMSIAQPIIAKTEGDSQRQKQVFRKLLRFTAFICFPLMLGLSLVAEEFIVILITDKWITSAHILRWLCIAGAVTPLSFLFSNLLITRGHSTTYMWCTFSFCLAQLIALGLFVPYGITQMVKAYVFINMLWFAVWFAFAHQKVHLSCFEALQDVTPYLALTLISIGISYLILPPIQNLYLSILSKIAVVALSYCAMLWVLGSTIFKEVLLFLTKKEIK